MKVRNASNVFRSLLAIAAGLAAVAALSGCGVEEPYGEAPACTPGTPAECVGTDQLRLCLAGVPIEWSCDDACSGTGSVGHCVPGGAGPADCVCSFALQENAPLCPPPARVDDDHCACDSPERNCVPSAFDEGSDTIAYCADGELRYAACECDGGDTPRCADDAAPGRAECRCEPCEARADYCLDRECGDDGCGGTCGSCGEHEACETGHCVPVPWCGDGVCAGFAAGEDCETCAADCGCECGEACRRGACVFTACDGRECGDDGCGGSCGPGCGCGEDCRGGACEFTACAGVECGFDTADCGVPCGPGCDSCFEECVEGRCEWFDRCEGRVCGSDGCGGTCGTCGCGERCEDGGCVAEDLCADRECGSDACGRSCGTCDPGSWCDDGRCVSACDGTVCGAPGYGPLACCTGPEVCVGFECCVPDDHWDCVDARTRRRADSCGNPSDELETCPGYCDADTGFCVPCEAVCTWGVCREGRCESVVCGDGECADGFETATTCPDDCHIAAPSSSCRDECATAGERRCAGRREREACADADGDGCLEWTDIASCATRGFCVDGACADLTLGH